MSIVVTMLSATITRNNHLREDKNGVSRSTGTSTPATITTAIDKKKSEIRVDHCYVVRSYRCLQSQIIVNLNRLVGGFVYASY